MSPPKGARSARLRVERVGAARSGLTSPNALARRRATPGGMSALKAELGKFIAGAAARKLYRSALRVASDAPEPARSEIRKEARRQFELGRNVDASDTSQVQWLLNEGTRQLKELKDMVGLSSRTL